MFDGGVAVGVAGDVCVWGYGEIGKLDVDWACIGTYASSLKET